MNQSYFINHIEILNYLSLNPFHLNCELARSFLSFTTNMYLPEGVETLFCTYHKILMFSAWYEKTVNKNKVFSTNKTNIIQLKYNRVIFKCKFVEIENPKH